MVGNATKVMQIFFVKTVLAIKNHDNHFVRKKAIFRYGHTVMSLKYNKDMPLKKTTIKCKRIKQNKDQFKHSDSVEQRVHKPCAGV